MKETAGYLGCCHFKTKYTNLISIFQLFMFTLVITDCGHFDIDLSV